jgi:hypothetical protein
VAVGHYADADDERLIVAEAPRRPERLASTSAQCSAFMAASNRLVAIVL